MVSISIYRQEEKIYSVRKCFQIFNTYDSFFIFFQSFFNTTIQLVLLGIAFFLYYGRVLKTPYYLALLDDIRATYPDALIIHTHRNPDQVLGSAASVHTKTFGIVSDDINLHTIGQEQVELQRAFLTKAMATRKKWKQQKIDTKTGFNVIDIHLQDLQQDTIGTVRQIFTKLLQRDLTKEGEEKMQQWLVKNKRDKHGRHKFSMKDFNIDYVKDDTFFQEYASFFNTKDAASSGTSEGEKKSEDAEFSKNQEL